MATATWIKNELEQRHIPYEERHHPEAYTAQGLAQCEHLSGHRVAKVVIVMADGKPVEMVLPASRRVLLDRVKEILGTHDARLAREPEIQQYFADCEVGAIPAFRHWPGVDVIVDGTLRTDGEIMIQAGTHCDAVCMRFDDWFNMVQPRVESFTEPADGCGMSEEDMDYWGEEGGF
jgi:Ala-tRNA(Pro) deacylase